MRKKLLYLLIVFFTLPQLELLADYYINVFTYADAQLKLEKGAMPYSFHLTYKPGQNLPKNAISEAKKKNYISFSNPIKKITKEKQFFLFFYDEKFKLRKIEKKIVHQQKEETVLKVYLDRNENLLEIAEKNPNVLTYKITFDKDQRQIESKVETKYGDKYIHRFSYLPNDEKKVAFFYQNTRLSQTIEKEPNIKEYYYQSSKQKNAFALNNYEISREESKDNKKIKWIDCYLADGVFVEKQEVHFENNKKTKTISSKGYEILYEYDEKGRLNNKIFTISKNKKIKKYFVFQYQPINQNFYFEFHELFRFNTTIEKWPTSFPAKKISEKQYVNYNGDLIGTTYINFVNDKKKIVEKQFDQKRIFKTIFEENKIKNFSIYTNNRILLSKTEYLYDNKNRLVEEKKWMPTITPLSEGYISKIKYLYSAPSKSENNTQKQIEIFGTIPKTIQIKLPLKEKKKSKIPEHQQSHLFYWGRSLYNYLKKNKTKFIDLKKLVNFIKNPNHKKKIEEHSNIYNNKDLIKTKIQKIINSQLRKVLFFNPHDEVIGYVRIHHEKKDKKKQKITFSYFGAEPLFFLQEQRNPKWFTKKNKNRDAYFSEQLRKESGRKDFLNESSDEIGSFFNENFLESYIFEFTEGHLPNKFWKEINSKEHYHENKEVINALKISKTKRNFKKFIKQTLIDGPVLKKINN